MREAFQDRFLDALAGDAFALSPWCVGPAADVGLSVYRNTIAKGRADALVAQFPTVERVVGLDWLAAAATFHGAAHPPRRASLLDYGEAFPDWLAAFPPAAETPFLAGLARLDLMWTQAHLAADAAPLDPAEIGGLAPEVFAEHGLVLHPAARFAGFADAIPSLWRALQPPGEPPTALELDDRPEGLLFTRPGLDIHHEVISAGALAFLGACRDGESLAAAAVAALGAEPNLDLSHMFASLMAASAFSALRTLS